MRFFNILVGVISIVSFVFILFPGFLQEVLKMDPYKLAVWCIFIACVIYWGYLLIMLVKHRNRPTASVNLRPVRVVRNPAGYQYLVEGNTCFHIPDPPTFNYLGSFFGFSWDDSELMLPDEINRRFTIGRQLPSIRPFLELIEKKE